PVLRSNLLCLLTACIWGFAFVAQRTGMDHIGPFAFTGIRFALGGVTLLPVIYFLNRKTPGKRENKTALLLGGLAAGAVMFAGAVFQQTGIVYTTAGKAGFITGFYVVLVPVLGIFLRQKSTFAVWIGALLCLAGLYLIGMPPGEISVQKGDLLVFVGAFFWALHVQLVGKLSKKFDTVKLACAQFFVCSILSLAAAAIFEDTYVSSVKSAWLAILYGGMLSVGVAFTLQVVAQKNAHPSHAAIIFSFESVFAALGGWLILSETMSNRNIAGCAVMFAGMILSQIDFPPVRIFKRARADGDILQDE
ncbi:MAG TPA: DMT family transporter, partial [Spirochaetota bacterium]|nr:DMT family transporter [Spirochaetota bacterium]